MNAHLNKAAVFLCVCALLAFAAISLHATEDSYSFRVHNTTKHTITKLLASDDGKDYGDFDIGDGIPPGKTVTLVWDESTDDENCKQWFKAVYDDGEESEAVKFDFCEEDLVLEF